MKKAWLILLLPLTACSNRLETREELRIIGGVKVICTWTHNNWNGNESGLVCIPVPVTP